MMTAYAPRIGVIGAGYWGLQLIRNCSELGVLVAVCDASAGRLETVAAQYPQCAVYQHLEALWHAPLDAVVIATPAETHAELTPRGPFRMGNTSWLRSRSRFGSRTVSRW